MNLRGTTPFRAALAGQDRCDVLQADGGGDERAGIDGARGVELNRPADRVGATENADRGDVLQRERAGVEEAGLTREPDVDDPPGRVRQGPRRERAAQPRSRRR